MKKINKNIMALAVIGAVSAPEAYADAQIYQFTTDVMNIINNAADRAAAQEKLCGSKQYFRGSGFTAGSKCKGQDKVRTIVLICAGHRDFKSSKCHKNIIKQINVNNAMTYVTDAVKNKYPNITKLVCESPKSKLPGDLLEVSKHCVAQAPARPTTAAPPMPRKQVVKLAEQELGRARLLSNMIQRNPLLKVTVTQLNMTNTQKVVESVIKNDPDKAADLLAAANGVANNLTSLISSLNAPGADIPAEKVKELGKFGKDIAEANSLDALLKEMNEVSQEAKALKMAR